MGRTVRRQYRDTCLTYEQSFWARVNYIHYNPVKHGLVSRPGEYPYSSYRLWQESDEVDLAGIESAFAWDRLDLE